MTKPRQSRFRKFAALAFVAGAVAFASASPARAAASEGAGCRIDVCMYTGGGDGGSEAAPPAPSGSDLKAAKDDDGG